MLIGGMFWRGSRPARFHDRGLAAGRALPQDIGKVLTVVRLVQAAAVRRGAAIAGNGPAGLLDEDRSRAAYQRETQRRAGVVSGGVEQAQAVRALAGRRVRIAEADPRLLGVHEAIRVAGVSDEVPAEVRAARR